MVQCRMIFAIITVASTEFILGLWGGWPSWALVKRPQQDNPAEYLKTIEHSWAVASFDLVNLLTAFPAAMLVNRIGRKRCLVAIAMGLAVSFGLLFVPFRWSALAARSFGGIWKSLAYTTVPSFLAEISADRARGRLAVTAASLDSLGMLVAMMVGPRVPYTAMNGFAVCMSLVHLVAVTRIHETPYFLLAKQRMEDARKSFKWYRWSGENATPLEQEQKLDRMNRGVQSTMQQPGTFRELFTDPGNRTALLLVCGACFAQRAGGVSCIIAFSTTTLPPNGPVRPENVAAVFATVRLVFTIAGGPLIDRFGRRPLLIGSHTSVAIVLIVYAYLMYDTEVLEAYIWGPSVCVVLFTIFYSLGGGIVPGTLIGEMFPINVKSHAVCVVSVISALAAFSTTSTYLPVAEAFGVHFMFLAFVAINLVWALCVYVFLFETKGMSLSAIQTVLDEYNTPSANEVAKNTPESSKKARGATA